MIGLIQRVSWAKVQVDEQIIAQIDQGILALVGMEKNDRQEQANKLLHRLLNYRIFADENGKMNLSVMDIQGGVLLVPQFTLAADTKKGMRPSFSSAKPPTEAQALFSYLLRQAQNLYTGVESGQFGADMKVSLLNDGPVTFSLTV
ncbi:MAG: D-aminoacyl-tRNA deacylase [Gammaproteobacteria bacterium]|nr:D-aminoacyl-tRNA deacylase [Gammaproteobacteria bacterium]